MACFFDKDEVNRIFKANTYKKPKQIDINGEVAYVAGEGLFWIIFGLFG